MSYVILRTEKASDQLYAIIQYIAESSGSIDVALNYLGTLEKRFPSWHHHLTWAAIPATAPCESKAIGC